MPENSGFEPPSYAEWISATTLSGRIFGTASRGATLQALDSAYKEWRDDISSVSRAEVLLLQLTQYAFLGGALFGPVTASHSERNKNNLFENLRDYLKAITSFQSASGKAANEKILKSIEFQEHRLQRARRATLMLMANVEVEPEFGSDVIGALGLCPGVRDLVGKTSGAAGVAISDITMASAAGASVVVGGVHMRQQIIDAVSNVKLPNIMPTLDDLKTSASSMKEVTWDSFQKSAAGAMGEVAGAFVAGLKLLWDALCWVKKKLGEVLTDTFHKIMGGDLSRITTIVNLILKIVFYFITSKAAPFVSSAKSIADGINSTVAAGFQQLENAVARSIIRTSEPTFAALSAGINAGLERKRNLGLWMTARGSIEVTLTALSAGVGSAIAGFVLGAIDWAFKLGLKIYEHSCIKEFREESLTMFNYIEHGEKINAAAPVAKAVAVRPEALIKQEPGLGLKSVGDRMAARASHAVDMASYQLEARVGAYASAHMPPFAAASWSDIGEGFYSNVNNSFTIYLNSLCQASPVLAAAVFNSGIFGADASWVYKAVTPRTLADEEVAKEQLVRLKSQARTMYEESGFKIKPVPVAKFKVADQEELNRLTTGAQLLVVQ